MTHHLSTHNLITLLRLVSCLSLLASSQALQQQQPQHSRRVTVTPQSESVAASDASLTESLHQQFQRIQSLSSPVTLPSPTTTTKDEAATSTTTPKQGKSLTLDTMSRNVRRMEYAVRGQVVAAADQITAQLRQQQQQQEPHSSESYPFDHIVYTNIGNPQSVGQKPLTWPRQVLALADLPNAWGVEHPHVTQLFPADAIRRAQEIKQALAHGSTGAYSHSQGAKAFRQDVADFMTKRDGGVPANPDDIFLTNGASQGIVTILNTILANDHCGIMIPIPQYPIYSATIDLLGGAKVGYNLNEEKSWALDMDELERSYQHAREEGIDVRALTLINPGNPCGSVLTRENLHDVVRFCSKHKIVLLADEVYQANVYDEHAEFISCKRACHETGLLEKDAIELISFHSTSKGVFGECGRRGGYMELVGIDPAVKDQIYKLASAGLCSSVSGQIMTSLMTRGPEPEDESYESHQGEMRGIFESLKRRSKILSEGLNSIQGFSCQPAQGSMYCFPSVQVPDGAVKASKDKGMTVDTLYSLSLLEETGICVVPASGFGQKAGRYGFRTTFLPEEKEMEQVVQRIRDHHDTFCQKYSVLD
eukprot:scaffold848_cov120-Amphora_coffeaeformis.AAC.2